MANNTKTIKSTTADKVVSVVTYTIVTLLCLSILVPCLNVLALSFNEGKDAARGGVFLWPRKFTLQNFMEVFEDGSIVNAYKITIARTVIGTVMNLACMFTAGFALTQRELPGRRFILFAITFCMLFGGGTIPTYLQYNNLGLLDNFWVYVIPSLYSVMYMMMIRTYIEGLPYALQEAAKLDGCGYYGTFFRIILPLCKPILAVIALYSAVNHWNEWYSGTFYMTSDKLWPVQTVLQQMLTQSMSAQQEIETASEAIRSAKNAVTTDALKMAAVVITTVPILCVYPFAQKYFAKGTLVGAVKG